MSEKIKYIYPGILTVFGFGFFFVDTGNIPVALIVVALGYIAGRLNEIEDKIK